MIEICDVNKSFGSLQVLKEINLQIRDGEIVTIVGPSGAGKTTLLQIMGTLSPADSGMIRYSGEDVTVMKDKALSKFRNSHIGFVFQFHQLLPEFTALENVILPALIGGASKREAVKRGEELLNKLGLGGRLEHRPAELSGGEKQRVAIARALINKPDVIFADEPTGSLDSRNREEIKQLFHDLRRDLNQTIVIVTHDASLTEIADRVVTMKDGRIIDITSKAEESCAEETTEEMA
ncbi:MAG: ABC transporter ATP-binding protein [Muribaculaceae bacterium]|nr:ABC transporter ATP-binding protein [Muribaculaceae bacterium]